MIVAHAQLKLLNLVRKQGAFGPDAESEIGVTRNAFDRLLAAVVARGFIESNGNGWRLTTDGEAVLEFAESLSVAVFA